ncbi:MAG: hypothetical protein AABX05_01420, partial [Nanoarchaeota archaeon]
MNYLFTNVLGSFVLDDKLNILDFILFKNREEYDHKEKTEEKLAKKHNTKPLPEDKLHQTLLLFKDSKYFPQFYQQNLELTKEALRHSVNEDNLIIQAICSVNELDKISNMMAKRLREWYSLYYPELSEEITNHEKYAELILSQSRAAGTMGADLEEAHVDEMKLVAEKVISLYQLRKQHELYLQ